MNKFSAYVIASSVFAFSSVAIAANNPNQNTQKGTTNQPQIEAIEVTETVTPVQGNVPFQAARDKLQKMTPEQRNAFKAQAQAKWQSLSPQEKQKFKVKMREKMDLMKKQHAERKIERIYTLYLLEENPQ